MVVNTRFRRVFVAEQDYCRPVHTCSLCLKRSSASVNNPFSLACIQPSFLSPCRLLHGLATTRVSVAPLHRWLQYWAFLGLRIVNPNSSAPIYSPADFQSKLLHPPLHSSPSQPLVAGPSNPYPLQALQALRTLRSYSQPALRPGVHCHCPSSPSAFRPRREEPRLLGGLGGWRSLGDRAGCGTGITLWLGGDVVMHFTLPSPSLTLCFA